MIIDTKKYILFNNFNFKCDIKTFQKSPKRNAVGF